ncbi:MAG: DNRLRE domain-containing protein [Pirellulales bacterium]
MFAFHRVQRPAVGVCFLFISLLVPRLGFAQQTVVSTLDGRGADATVRGFGSQDRSDLNFGDDPSLYARWNPGTSEPHNDKSWFRLDLSGISRPITAAQLEIYWDRDADFTGTYDFYGLNELADYGINTRTGQQRLGEDWSESAITWNNAPGNPSSLTDNSIQSAAYLFTLSNPDAPATLSSILGASSQRLIDFLNSDTNDLVTFIVRKPIAQTFLGDFASKETIHPNAHPPRLVIDDGAPLIPAASEWKYYDIGQDPGNAWKSPDFDDSSWKSGPAELGYGDGDESTLVRCGPDPNCLQNNLATTLFRREFDLAEFGIGDPERILDLRATIQRDDGAAIYLNGIEVFRDAVLSPTAGYGTYAAAQNIDNYTTDFSIDPALLVAGKNVIAVEVHQASAASSDLSFDFRLTASVAVPEPPGWLLSTMAIVVAACALRRPSAIHRV